MFRSTLLAGLFFLAFNIPAEGSALLPSGSVRQEDPRATADKLVGMLFSAYQTGNRQAIEDVISDDFSPVRMNFVNDLHAGSVSGNILEMDYILDEVLITKDKLIAGFSWEKKLRPAGQGEAVLTTGKAQGAFARSHGVWQLVDLTGESPF